MNLLIALIDPTHVDHNRAHQWFSSGQITGSYLLALAVAHGGNFATLDRHIVADAVIGGSRALYSIP